MSAVERPPLRLVMALLGDAQVADFFGKARHRHDQSGDRSLLAGWGPAEEVEGEGGEAQLAGGQDRIGHQRRGGRLRPGQPQAVRPDVRTRTGRRRR